MTFRSCSRSGLFALLLWLPWVSAQAHDLTASHLIARLKPEGFELQVKIAADSAWPLVQEISPGAVYTPEEFETVWRPVLLAFAKTMDELTVDGKPVTPTQTTVLTVEDTFLFSFSYPVPASGTVRVKELYLKKMAPDYISYLRLFDRAGKPVANKNLTVDDPVFEFKLPVGKPAPTAPSAKAETSPKP